MPIDAVLWFCGTRAIRPPQWKVDQETLQHLRAGSSFAVRTTRTTRLERAVHVVLAVLMVRKVAAAGARGRGCNALHSRNHPGSCRGHPARGCRRDCSAPATSVRSRPDTPPRTPQISRPASHSTAARETTRRNGNDPTDPLRGMEPGPQNRETKPWSYDLLCLERPRGADTRHLLPVPRPSHPTGALHRQSA